jgi:ribonucleoside-diphosphate reductase beta chain
VLETKRLEEAFTVKEMVKNFQHLRLAAPSTFSDSSVTMDTTTYTIGTKSFVLDRAKAEEAYAAKRIINGRDTMFFNILPLKYNWAYELYATMKANHWEPEDIPMQKDVEQWRDTSGQITEIDRWIIRMAIGYFSAAEGIVGDNIIHVTASWSPPPS